MRRCTAEANGRKTYKGNPCQYGHSGQRYTSTGGCVDCTIIRATKLQRERKSAHHPKRNLSPYRRQPPDKPKPPPSIPTIGSAFPAPLSRLMAGR